MSENEGSTEVTLLGTVRQLAGGIASSAREWMEERPKASGSGVEGGYSQIEDQPNRATTSSGHTSQERYRDDPFGLDDDSSDEGGSQAVQHKPYKDVESQDVVDARATSTSMSAGRAHEAHTSSSDLARTRQQFEFEDPPPKKDISSRILNGLKDLGSCGTACGRKPRNR